MRISRDELMIELAKTVSLRGTCSRLQVGAIVTRYNRVISMGYNGTPAGMPHCVHTPEDGAYCRTAVHAEANAIVFAARAGISTDLSQLFTTHSPCLSCAQLIINAGIVQVTYCYSYRDPAGVELLHEAGIDVRDTKSWTS